MPATKTVNNIKVAVLQDAPVGFDSGASVAKACDLLAAAGSQGVSLAVFPEAFIGGYPKGSDFGARVGLRSAAGRREFERYARGAIQVPGPETARLGEAAKRHAVHLLIGVIERDLGTLYCTALCFADTGELLGRHRKVMPTAMERLIWGFGDGSTLGVWQTSLGRIGAVICWENYMPLLRAAMFAQGVQLYCAPTVDDRETWLPTMRHVALEGRCFVLSACQFLRRRDLAAPGEPQSEGDPDAVLIRGGSCVVGPLGHVLVGPVYDRPGLLTADLDPAELMQGKFDLDVAGHYARPDIFRLQVNREATPAVRWEPESPG